MTTALEALWQRLSTGLSKRKEKLKQIEESTKGLDVDLRILAAEFLRERTSGAECDVDSLSAWFDYLSNIFDEHTSAIQHDFDFERLMASALYRRYWSNDVASDLQKALARIQADILMIDGVLPVKPS
jgi:hypothetical protein